MCYGNEDEVGKGLKEAFATGQVKREDVFVTTKLWGTYHTKVAEGIEESLQSLGLDYVDLFLVHWPVAMNPNGNDEPISSLRHFRTMTTKIVESRFSQTIPKARRWVA